MNSNGINIGRFGKIVLSLALGSIFLPSPSVACVKEVESLDSILDCYLNRSVDLKNAKESLDSYAAVAKEKNLLQVPKLFADISSSNQGLTSDQAVLLNYDKIETKDVDVGLKGRWLRLGVDYYLQFGKQIEQIYQNKTLYQTVAEAKLELNLLKNNGFNFGYIPFKQIDLELNERKLQFEKIKSTEVKELIDTYLHLQLALKQTEILESIALSNQSRTADLSRLESIGKTSGLNLISAQEQLAGVKLELESARLQSSQAKQMLCQSLNLSNIECKIKKLKPIDFLENTTKLDILLKNLLAKREKERIDIKILKNQIEKTEVSIDSFENEASPNLDLSYSAKILTNPSDRNVVEHRRDGFEDKVALSLTIPLDNSLNKNIVADEKMKRFALTRDLKLLQLNSDSDLANWSENQNFIKSELRYAQEKFEFSKKKLDTARAGYKSGSVPLKDVLDYETHFKEATLQLEASTLKSHLSVLDLAFLTQDNQLLELFKSK